MNTPELKAKNCAKSKKHYWANREKKLAYSREYSAKNREKLRQKGIEWRRNNPDKQKACCDAWIKKNPGARERMQKEWSDKNGERKKFLWARWYAANRGMLIEKARSKRKLTNANPIDSARIAEWETKWRSRRKAKCYWCLSVTTSSRCHTDHIVALTNGGPHEIGNLCISCAKCNLSKGSKTVAQWNGKIKEPSLL